MGVVMSRILLRVFGVSGLIITMSLGGAAAADLPLPVKAPVPPPVTDWSGFYLGGYGGGGGGYSRWDFANVGTTTGNFNITGGFAGGTAGFNWQRGWAVFGIEADGGWAGFSGTSPLPNPLFTGKTSDTWLSSVRGRLGWTPTPNVLLYGTGGGAFGDIRTTAVTSPPGGIPPQGSTSSANRAGWSAGAGIEWMFLPSWSVKAEYLHYDLGSSTCGPGLCGFNPAAVRFVVDTGKIGINYHFNWGTIGRY
jgi:outer membrane immunogenic protein